ncbi:hypothetical protein PVAND_007240 [Polypedilum vanderplanki]|uniref:Zinc finger protein n=1 Tax=Polypedilum vanderplanki TaxID=319348 RepID=A0A9J6C625_POLVA|nr:hypothetical protein PVAND_007240 [Polypedilum vanderplanki]
MENFNNIINNDYNAMVYGSSIQQQLPMTSIPREMHIEQDQAMHQVTGGATQQSDIINLSYNQRDMQLPHPDLPQQMGLYPTVSIPQQPHNHILQEPQTEQQQITQNVNISYTMDSVNVSVNLDVQNNNNDNNTFETVDGNKEVEDSVGENSQQAAIANNIINEVKKEIQEQITEEDKKEEEEEGKSKEPEVDPNQCRVCKATESLIDIFAIEEDMRICDIIMKLCSNIRIHERDYLPHMICIGCLGRLRTAYAFMKDVVATDKELRSKLKRHRRARKPIDGFVIIDCNEASESDDDDLPQDDDEYQVSNAEEEDDDYTSSAEDSDSSRKVKQPKKRGRKPKAGRKAKKEEMLSTAKRLKRDIVFIEADDSSDERNKKREKCKDCGKQFSSKPSLMMHRKKAHMKPSSDDTPFKCHVCGRGFKYSINLTSHMQIHKDSFTCDECGRVFATKSDVKKHALNQHKCSLSYECNKCRRLYCSVKRYQKHREHCSDYSSSSLKRKPMKGKDDVSYSGRDLFKTVAPLTTTYWSDSFSD